MMRWRGVVFLIISLAVCSPAVSWANVSSCTVTLALSETPTLEAMQFVIDYSAVQGSFAGKGMNAECIPLLPDTSSTAFDSCDGDYAACQWGEKRVLRAALLGARGFKGPADVLKCSFEAVDSPKALDFSVRLEAATLAGTSANYAESKASLDISSINCRQADTKE